MGIVTATIDLEEVIAAFLPIASPYAAKEKVWITDKRWNFIVSIRTSGNGFEKYPLAR